MKQLVVLIAILLVLTLPAMPARTQTIKVEAESFNASYDIDYGIIGSVPNSGCSGGNLLTGLDYPGEWVKYYVPVPIPDIYAAIMRCRGDMGAHYRLQLTIHPLAVGQPPQIVTFDFYGEGYG
jgi:hypothetical protein